MSTSRKDYAANAVISPANEVVKRVNTQNSPYSVQATGLDKSPDKHILITEENIDTLTGQEFVYQGNMIKKVKTVNKDASVPPVLVDVVLIEKDLLTGVEKEETVTRDEILNSSNMFIGKTN